MSLLLRFLVFIAFGVVLALFGSRQHPQPQSLQPAPFLQQPTSLQRVQVRSGTGFFINQEYIVTNAHVVKGCDTVMIQGAVPRQQAKVQAFDVERDLAVMKTAAVQHHVTRMRFDVGSMREGDLVFIIGYPGAEGAKGKYKFIDAMMYAHPQNMKGWFYITDRLEHGESGGPVFDTYGNVIGIVVAKSVLKTVNRQTREVVSTTPVGVVIGLNVLYGFLSDHGIKGWVSASGYGSAYRLNEHIEEEARNFIVNVQCAVKGQ